VKLYNPFLIIQVVLFLVTPIQNFAVDQTTSTDSLKQFAGNSITLLSEGYQDSAQYWYNRVIARAPQCADIPSTASILLDLARAYEMKGLHILSLKPYLMGLSLLSSSAEKQITGQYYLDLSNVTFRMGNNERSLEYCIEASKIYKDLKDTINYISASMLIAQVYISTGKLDEARAIYDQMLELSMQVSDSVLIADNLDHIGVIYSFLGDYPNTLKYFKEALKINAQLNNVKNQAINYANIGEVFMKQGNYEEGLLFLKKGLSLAEKSDFNSLKVFIYYTFGELHSRMNNADLALKNFKNSLALISETGEYREQPIVYKLMSEHFERKKLYADALAYFKLYSSNQDSIDSQAVNYGIEELKVRYDIEKMEEALHAEQLLLSDVRRASAKTIRQQKIGIIISFFGMLITTTLGIILYKSQQRLRLANRTREILISIIGHDLRGPMANINKLMEMLKANILPDKDDYVRLLEKPVKASYDLLQDLLTWSLIVNNRMSYNPEKVTLKEVVDKCFALLNEMAVEKRIELNSTIPEGLMVFADKNHLSTALRNLVSNGIKFTPIMGKITVGCTILAGTIKVEVTDTGIGIDAENIIKILSQQSVYSTRGTKNEKGSGLGLLLTKECVRLNGGVFAIVSEPGKGSTFSFTLPNRIPIK